MFLRKQVKDYRFLAGFLATRILANVICVSLLRVGSSGKIDIRMEYKIYFYVYWTSYAIEAGLGLAIIYSIYRLAMAPLKGLQALGMLMFRWAAAISFVVAFGMAFGPRVTGLKFMSAAVSQLQQTQSILTLCMLLFVTFAIRPMGLSYSSKVFGVSLGLGILAAMDLISSAWMSTSKVMTSTVSLMTGFAIFGAVAVWTTYFALPEPKRRIIVLPTTSPFLRWNQISLALGDNPGYVAIAGIPPEVFAPSEVEIMRRASLKMIIEPIHR
jgi:hypothetical protein